MIRKSLAAVFALSLIASAGEWRYWTWPGQAQMSTVVGRTAWFATSGGVFEWNLDANTSRLHQWSDGLPSTDIVSIASQKDGSIWAASADGKLAVKRPTEPNWQSKGTYSAPPNPWSFNPRAVAMHRNSKTGREVLILGGPQGLTFFPADTGVTLDWTDQFASLGKREVRAITLIDDTLWVGLMGGLVKIVPPWDSLGNNRAFVADPKRWTILAETQPTDDYSALFPTDDGMTWQPRFTYGAKTVLLKSDSLFWSGRLFIESTQPDNFGLKDILVVHALDNKTELLVSSSTEGLFFFRSRGPYLITSDGDFRYPPLPSNAFPFPPPPTAVLQAGMKITAWSSNRILTWSRGQSLWTSPWDDAFEKGTNTGANFELTDNVDMNTFKVGSDGSIWAGTWGYDFWSAHPSATSPDSLKWKRWSQANSCLEGVNNSIPFYITINSITTTDSATWGITYRNSGDSAQVFSVAKDGSSMQCWSFPNPDTYNSDILVEPDRIKIATHQGLRVFRRPSTSATRLTQFSPAIAGDFRRLKQVVVGGQTYTVANTPTTLYLIASLPNKDTILVNSAKQASPLTAQQEWRKMAIDGLGQLWLGGSQGIDIVSIQETIDGLEFQKVRSITVDDGLPSNLIYDISIDPTSGNALVATDMGLGLWTSPFRPSAERLEKKKARVYPNPLRTRSHSELVVDGATATSDFYLHAADGSLVVHLGPEKQSGGYFRWALPGTDKLRPGVYRWTLKDSNTKVGGPLLVAE